MKKLAREGTQTGACTKKCVKRRSLTPMACSVKYEEVYLREYSDGWTAEESLARYFEFYCEQRIHQSLGYRTPADESIPLSNPIRCPTIGVHLINRVGAFVLHFPRSR